MWLMPDLLWEARSFEPALRCLVRLALAETEDGIANNATGVLGATFLLRLAPTTVPLPIRIAQASRLFEEGTADVRSLLASAVASALVFPEIGLVTPHQGSLDGNWRPENQTERVASRRLALKFLTSAFDAGDVGIRDIVAHKILRAFRSLALEGLLPELIAIASRLADEPRYLAEVRSAVEASITFERGKLGAPDLILLRNLYSNLPSDLHSQLRIAVGSWDLMREERAEAGLPQPLNNDELARRALTSTNPETFVPLLFEAAAKNAGPMAAAMGVADTDCRLLTTFVSEARAHGAWIASVYVAGALSVGTRNAVVWAKGALEAPDDFMREVATRAVTSSTPNSELLDRVLSALVGSQVRAAWLSGIVYGGWTSRVAPEQLNRLLSALTKTSDPAGISVAVNAALQAQHGQVALDEAVLLDITLCGIGRLTASDVWHWAQVAEAVVARHPVQVANAILKAAIANSNEFFAMRDEVGEVFRKCLETAREDLIEPVLEAVLVEGKFRPQIVDLIGDQLLETAGVDRLLDWAEANGIVGQVVLGQMLPPRPDPATFRALERFGAASVLGNQIRAAYGSGSFMGDPSEHYESAASVAQQWSQDATLPETFRQWASRVVAGEKAVAAQWREHHETEELLERLDRS
jgi:hypothetical protein